MIHVSRKHNARLGRHVQITCSEDVFDVLVAAIQVSFEDPSATPEFYEEQVTELWEALVQKAVATREP